MIDHILSNMDEMSEEQNKTFFLIIILILIKSHNK
jgi:hypothetical protein